MLGGIRACDLSISSYDHNSKARFYEQISSENYIQFKQSVQKLSAN